MGCRSCWGLALCAIVLALQYTGIHAVSFAWGPSSVVHSVTSGQISYQSVHTKHVVSSLLHAIEGLVDADPSHKAVFLVAEDAQASLETLPHTASSKLQGLVSLLEAAPAQISLPNAALHGSTLAEHLPLASSSNTTIVADACVDSDEAAAAALQRHAAHPVVVLHVCPTTDAAGALPSIARAAEKAERTVVGLFAATGQQQASVRRSMQVVEGDAAPYTCDDKCKAQVRALEAFILIIIVLMAIGGGTWIMGAVDTPTRFAAPKKDHSAMD